MSGYMSGYMSSVFCVNNDIKNMETFISVINQIEAEHFFFK